MVLIDTNVWLTVNDRDATHHRACADLLRRHAGGLAVASLVAAETSWMLLSRFGTTAQATFLRMIVTGTVTVIDLSVEDWRRVGELCDVYASQQLDAVDASLIAIAERLDLTDIATFNGRDFYTVRPRHTTGFTLLPEGVERPVGKI